MKYFFTASAFLVPGLVFAQDFDKSFGQLVYGLSDFFETLLLLLMSLSVFAFLFGLMRTLASSGNADKLAEARVIMVWGVVALFVLFSIFGIVNIFVATFDDAGLPTPGSFDGPTRQIQGDLFR